jgi:hypothetical protein
MAIYVGLFALIVGGAITYYLLAPTIDPASSFSSKANYTLNVISWFTVFSLGYDVLLVGLMGWRILSPGSSNYDSACFCVLLLPLLGLVIGSIYAFRKGNDRYKSYPLLLNLTALGLCILLAVISSVWDVSFSWYYKDYMTAIQTLDLNIVKPAQERTAKLPIEYNHLATGGEVYFVLGGETDGQMVAFPESPSDLDGLFGAYVFAPRTELPNVPKQCLSGYPVNPYHEHWYYCVLGLGQIYGWPTR